jgi:Holliday junction resolvase RusA-like endonuclease
MTPPITFTVDLPPSVNKVWRHSGKRVFRDPKYVAWQRTAGWELQAQRPDRFPANTHVAVTIRAGKAKRARDADNLGKGICDLLQAHQIVTNDRDIRDIRIVWDESIEPGRVRVEARVIEKVAA